MFTPSPEQQAIFDEWLKGTGNIAVRALAGTGKTTTLVELSKIMPPVRSAVYCAFNTDIVKEVKDRFAGNIQCRTFHSLGYGALAKYLKAKNFSPDANKYRQIVKDWLEGCPEFETVLIKIANAQGDYDLTPGDLSKYMTNLLTGLTNMLRLKLVEWDDALALQQLMEHYNLDEDIIDLDEYNELVSLAIGAVPEIMKKAESKARLHHAIDFTDMIYWVVRWDLSIWKYNVVFVDECQDLSPMQRAMVKKSVWDTGRVILVGDPNQAIYEFAGADSDSFELSTKMFNAKIMPLNTTRRCDKHITTHAKRLVPEFVTLDQKPEGNVFWVDRAQLLRHVQQGDMLLSRVKAPLIGACLELIAGGKPATILGSDIGRSLVSTLEKITKLNDFTWDKLDDFIEKWKNDQVEKWVRKENQGMVQAIEDQVAAINVILETYKPESFEAFDEAVSRLFSDQEKNDTIILATIHKSKGMEAERVFILAPDKLPLNFPGQRPETAKQEKNLEYVAITRAKHSLYYFVDKEYKKNHAKPSYIVDLDIEVKTEVTEVEDKPTVQLPLLESPKQATPIEIKPITTPVTIPVEVSPIDPIMESVAGILEKLDDNDLDNLINLLCKLRDARRMPEVVNA